MGFNHNLIEISLKQANNDLNESLILLLNGEKSIQSKNISSNNIVRNESNQDKQSKHIINNIPENNRNINKHFTSAELMKI
jgi:hypothetical protein